MLKNVQNNFCLCFCVFFDCLLLFDDIMEQIAHVFAFGG